MKRLRIALLASAVCVGTAGPSHAFIVDFEDQPAGPSLFGGANQTLVYNFPGVTATFTGGTILTTTANLPVDQTNVYGTVSSTPNTNPLTITFSAPVNNFFLDILNGNVITETYTIADNDGHSQNFAIPPNLNSGLKFFSIPASGDVVTITSAATGGFWDFFVDNVGFDQPTPSVPEPISITLLGVGLAGLALARRRKPD